MSHKKSWEPIDQHTDIPEPSFEHPVFGKPTVAYRYETMDGSLFGYIARFVNAGGKKEVRPYTFGLLDGRPCWAWRAAPKNRPLYKSSDLAVRSTAIALVVEGEKAADAASILFPELVVTTTMFGALAPAKSDWSGVKGRHVVIWPDNDEAGQKFALMVGGLAHAAGAADVRTVEVPKEFPQKWDLADPIPQGFDKTSIWRLIEAAPSSSVPSQINTKTAGEDLGVKYPPFRLTASQVEYEVLDNEENAEWQPLCSRLEVQALTRNADGEDWGRLVYLKDADGREHTWAMPMRMLAGDGSEYRERLLDLGLIIEPGRNSRDFLQKYIATCEPKKRLCCVTRIGWHQNGATFVLPDQTYGCQSVVLQQEASNHSIFRVKGTLSGWQESVAYYAEGNSRLVLCLSAAFAAPLLSIVGAESGGFHLDGPSSRGKSTASMVAGSAWGGGGINGFQIQWRATVNGLEGVAANHCDALLCLDEIGQAQPDAVGEAAYMLANDAGKARANRSGHARKPLEWRLIFLSTGEKSLAARMKEGSRGGNATAGQEVRIVNVPADTASGFGLFEKLHNFSNGAELSNHLKGAAAENYGVAIREFLTKLTAQDRLALASSVASDIASFCKNLNIESADGQVGRVAQRFGLMAAAGNLATKLGILPWQADTASWGAEVCFRAWLDHRGGQGGQESQRLLDQVRLFLERHGESRFTDMSPVVDDRLIRPTANRAGFRRSTPEGWEYLVLPAVFREELCAGFDLQWASKTLVEASWLVPGENGRPARNERLPGKNGTSRCYRFTSKVFEGEDTPCGSIKTSGNTESDGNYSKVVCNLNDSADPVLLPKGSDRQGTGNGNATRSQPLPRRSHIEEPIYGNDTSGVPYVPTDPKAGGIGSKATAAFEALYAAAVADGPEVSPRMDDLSARCINRLGGWPSFCAKIGELDLDEVRQEFASYFAVFVPGKLAGHYDNDMPRVCGTIGSQGVFRTNASAQFMETPAEATARTDSCGRAVP